MSPNIRANPAVVMDIKDHETVSYDRRRFLDQLGRSAAFLALGPAFGPAARSATDETTLITLLHTNDLHSHLEPFSEDDRRNADLGGAARRATLVKRVRRENPNTLLVDAGDAFQGTPFYNFYRGEADYRIMSDVGYDVVNLGNHDFDGGLDALSNAMKFATFAIVSANYDFSRTPLRGRIKPYVIKQFDRVKVGIFGIGIAFEGLVMPANRPGVGYRDPVLAAREAVRRLRQTEGAVLVICLSHLGIYDRPSENTTQAKSVLGDRQLAEQVEGIDAIIGGHTHTFMREPVVVQRPGGGATLIFQVGFGGIKVGRLDFLVKGNKVKSASGRLLSGAEMAVEARADFLSS